MSQHGSYGIEDTYRGVINDVIVQVREAFLDEGIDVDVLQQLKKTWETKLMSSDVFEMERPSNVSGKSGSHQQQLQPVQQVSPPSLRHPTTTATTVTRQQFQPNQQTVVATNNLPIDAASHSQPLLVSGGQPAQIPAALTSQPITTNSTMTSASNIAVEHVLLTTQPQQNVMGGTATGVKQQQQQRILGNAMTANEQLAMTNILQQSQQHQQQLNTGVPLFGLPAQLCTSRLENSNILQQSALRILPPGAQYAIMGSRRQNNIPETDGPGGAPNLILGPGGAQNLVLLATAAGGQINPLANIEQPHHSGGEAAQVPTQYIGQSNVHNMGIGGGQIGGKFMHNQQQQQQRKTTTVAMKVESNGGINQLPQLDGGGGQCMATQIVSSVDSTHVTHKQHRQTRKAAKCTLDAVQIGQLDGGKGKTAAAPGMTDESSEDEDREDEEDPTLAAIKYGLSEEHNEGEAEEEEEPLNSGDDQSDDEDLDTLFDADNVVVCQFEKVHRARNKWKFTLKDGIMQIRGKDYCFQKCTGEAEW